MRVCAISDLHGCLPGYRPSCTEYRLWTDRHVTPFRIEPCDLLLIAGDVCPTFDHSPHTQREFLGSAFCEWLENVPAKQIVGVAGNHDFIFQREPGFTYSSALKWDYLQDSGCVVPRRITDDTFRIWGTPWQQPFVEWAFNLPEPELAKKWDLIPEHTDILVLHGPPKGYGDVTADGVSCGSQSLRERIWAIKPKLTVFGHIHEGRGRWDEHFGTLANVTMRDEKYRVVHPPMYFDL